MTTAAKTVAAQLGRVGLWAGELRFGDPAVLPEAARELDDLGFRGLWFPGGVGGDVTGPIDRLLDWTPNAVIATGIINVWKHEPSEFGNWWRGLPADRQSRVLLGVGASHGPLIGGDYVHPLAKVSAFLDGLDAGGLPPERRCIAALRPKMLELARDRTAGSHPYLTTPEHTRYARELLGPGALLAPEQGVVLETDPDIARDLGRKALGLYQKLPNYTGIWRRFGFSETDVAQMSDALVDGLIAWGGLDRVIERVEAHLAAGADHVCLQVIGRSGQDGDLTRLREAWRELAKLLV